jgi:hypothetical protein
MSGRVATSNFANSKVLMGETNMDKAIEQSLTAQLAREGLEPKPGDLEEFAKIIELYVDNLKTLHSVNLGAEELAPVFRPEWTKK